MCGRYALYTPREKLTRDFSASLNYDFGASYNISPTATIAVLIALDKERLIVPMRWGLIPSWHKDGKMKYFVVIISLSTKTPSQSKIIHFMLYPLSSHAITY